MINNKLVGALGFPVTPFDADNQIIIEEFRKNVEFLINNDLKDVFVACGAGEFNSLSVSEYEELLKTASEYSSDEVKIYAGIGGNIQISKEQIKIAEKYNITGFLIMPPYLINPSSEGLYNYLNEIISSTRLETIVYHRDNCRVNASILEKLAVHDNLVGFKDGVGKMEELLELKNKFGDRFVWINGLPLAELTMYAYYNMGIKSYSSAISNYIPHISHKYLEALEKRDDQTEREIFENVILPIHRVRESEKGYAVALIKAGMNIVHGSTPLNVRGPVSVVKEEHYNQLKEIINGVLLESSKIS